MELSRRAAWLHRCCRVLLPRLGVRLERRGPRPARGLVISNHLSYLDIAVFAAIAPCVFVSKREVGRWPAFGFLARCGGTIFIDRQSRSSTEDVARRIAEALRTGVPVLLFPEGTSTDGSEVLRFHPSLLEPAIRIEAPINAAAIGYRLPGGRESDLCYYGDIHFVPHLLETLGRSGVSAEVKFYPEAETYQDRKTAALSLREMVIALRRDMPEASELLPKK
jgi:lyso-ornithine lipid O-acyltransferase